MFSSKKGQAEQRVRRVLRQLGQDIEGFRAVDRLFKRFGRPRGNIRMMVFLISEQHILDQLIDMKDRIYDLPVILSLPDSRRETLLKGHKFYPRFIMFADGDTVGFEEVLENLIHQDGMLFHSTLMPELSEDHRFH